MKKKPVPKETINQEGYTAELYEEKDYKKMELYDLALIVFNLKQMVTLFGNRIWRLKNEQGKLKKHMARIETIKEDKFFINKGLRRVKEDKE